MSYDQLFRTGGSYATAGKSPYILFADQELTATGYVNNSLEGTLFSADPALSGTIVVSGSYVTPKWTFYDQNSGVTSALIVASLRVATTGICTATYDTASIPLLAVGDVVSINGVGWDATHPFINGSYVVTSATPAGAASKFTFNTLFYPAAELNYDGLLSGAWPEAAYVRRGPAFSIYDNRAASDAKGLSFTSVLFTPKKIYDAGTVTGYKRVLPSDLYTRFKFQSSSDAVPQGGINSNLFNVVSEDDVNIKPVLWSYFFGYNTATPPTSIFEIVFNSYAIVLRPSGDGSKLEFALLKFSWGAIANFPALAAAEEDKFKSYTVDGTTLGYLVCTNPEVVNTSTTVVTELAKSDAFTYNAEITPKFNLKITIRKHLLSDSILDGTYLVNLMVNDDYDDFGPAAHYDTVLHAYITKPSPVYNTTTGVVITDCMLMPMMYFKYNNTNEDNVGIDIVSPPSTGASKIVQDSLFFRQINAVDDAAYLY